MKEFIIIVLPITAWVILLGTLCTVRAALQKRKRKITVRGFSSLSAEGKESLRRSLDLVKRYSEQSCERCTIAFHK